MFYAFAFRLDGVTCQRCGELHEAHDVCEVCSQLTCDFCLTRQADIGDHDGLIVEVDGAALCPSCRAENVCCGELTEDGAPCRRCGSVAHLQPVEVAS